MKITKKLARDYYQACHDGLSRFTGGDVSIYWDGSEFVARSSGLRGMGLEVAPNIAIDHFMTHGDITDYTEDQFVEMCLDCFGTPELMDDECYLTA